MGNKKINDPTREGEERYRLIAENTGDYIAILGIDGVLKYTSPSHRWLGYGPGELEGKNGLDLIHPDDKMKLLPLLKMYTKKAMDSIFRKHLADGSAAPEKLEFRFPDKKGNWVYLESTSNFIKSLTGKGYDILLVSRDVTERKKAQELLNETGKMAKVGGWEFDVETLDQVWTEEVYRIHEVGLDYKPTVSDGIDFYHPEDRAVIREAVRKAIELGEPFDLELRFIAAKGNLRWVHAIGRAYRKNGKTVKVGGTFQDITERKKAAEEIKKKIAALEQYKELTVDRETRMVELKEEVNRLSEELGRPKPY